ncbi:AraC family transcriptional regulator [Nitrosomonas sp.]|uniref:helix-turn-helix domain-containing protein n=1 Tax=Nitrosomonas sp. TaxID=42353 RepID=UPI0033060551
MGRLKPPSCDFPENERVPAFQNIHAAMISADIPSYLDQSSFMEMSGQLLPNLRVYAVTAASHLSSHTHDPAPAESSNNVVLLVPLDGMAIINGESSDSVCCQPGEALLITIDSIHQVHIADTVSLAIIDIPATLIAPRVSKPDDCLIKKISSASIPALRLLAGYTKILIQIGDSLSPDLTLLVSTQIHDLVMLLFSAKREEAQVAGKCRLRAVRLEAIKRDILEHITESELSINQVARRQDISPQYIRALFHNEETTFADYVTELRLKQAYQYLCNPVYIGHCISTLAFDMGFNNLSWFNRAFKQQFGLTPSEVRNLSRRSEDQS